MSAFVPEYDLYLFVAGTNSKSIAAQRNLQAICAHYLLNRYALQIIDAQQHPEAAIEEGILGLPCLIKKRPGLVRRLVGDLSDQARVLKALGIS